MNDEQAAVASAITGGMRSQIRVMYRRDGLSVEDIGEAMRLPVGIVESALRGTLVTEPVRDAKGSEDELFNHIAEIENVARQYKIDAVQKLADLIQSSEAEAIAFASSREILRIATGGYRPQKQSSIGVSIDQLNTFMKQAIEARDEAEKQSKAITV